MIFFLIFAACSLKDGHARLLNSLLNTTLKLTSKDISSNIGSRPYKGADFPIYG